MAKVSIIRCGDYDRARVYDAVKRATDLSCCIKEAVKPNMKVLVKPNLLSARAPEDAVDTHPEVVRAVVRLVKEAGGRVLLGDSPAASFNKNVNDIYEISGMRTLANEEGIDLVKFTSAKFVDGIPISRYVFDCDLVISVPKLKTHCITMITAAIKNTYGLVVGMYKAAAHSKAPHEQDFAKVIAKVFSIAKPNITILDGIVAMEGDGPSSGEPRKLGFVMAGFDAVAVDSCLTDMIGLKPLDILVTKEAYEMNLGEADLSLIEILGDDFDSFRLKDFKLPLTMPMRIVPGPIAKSIAHFVRFKPFIDKNICKRCKLCKITCPVACIQIEKDDCKIDYHKCVRCLCCHEVCPYKAISIKRNVLTRLVWG